MNLNITKRFLALSVTGTLLLAGCKKADDFFQLRDRGGIDAAIWDNEGAIQFYLNEAYDKIIPPFPHEYTLNNFEIHLATDESYFGANNTWTKRAFGFNGALDANQILYAAVKYQGSNIGDNRYFDVARCNNVIRYVPTGTALPNEVKKKMLGQAYALRAILYFGLAKIYGGMPLVLEPQNPDNLQLAGRATANEMFAQIVKDLDSAMIHLEGVTWDASTEWGKLTKSAAAALKAKALLYWASPQFNPLDDGNHPYDASRWQTALAACREAYDICIANGHGLMPDYGNIFRTEGMNNTEAIIVRSYSAALPKMGNNVEYRSRPSSEGGAPNDCYYASTRLIDAYTMNDGTPISQSPDYDPVLFWKDRDPRFNATIAYNGSTWPLSGITGRRQWTYVNAINETGNRAFYCKRFTSPSLASGSVRNTNDYGGSGVDWIEMRFAEVILNYAEAANETGDLALSKDLVRQVRQRAEIAAGANDYGLALATSKEEMRDLITNERMVEFAFEGKRCDDLRRLRLLTKLTGTITSLQFEANSNDLRAELETIIDPASGRRYRETLDMNDKDTVMKYFKYPYTEIIPGGNGSFSVPDYYYFYSLSNQFMNSSSLLKQTIGWGGDFDPLQ